MRVVAAAVRARYIGTQLNMSGLSVSVFGAALDDLLGGHGFTHIASRIDTKVKDFNRKWNGAFWKPCFQDAYDYNDGVWDATNANNMRLAVFVNGVAGQPFEWEVITFCELLPSGGNLVENVTASHSDILGLSDVRDYLGQLSSSDFGMDLYNRGLSYLSTKYSVSDLAGGVGKLALTYL